MRLIKCIGRFSPDKSMSSWHCQPIILRNDRLLDRKHIQLWIQTKQIFIKCTENSFRRSLSIIRCKRKWLSRWPVSTLLFRSWRNCRRRRIRKVMFKDSRASSKTSLLYPHTSWYWSARTRSIWKGEYTNSYSWFQTFFKHIITWSANKSGSRFGSPALREAVGDNYWTFVQNNPPDDAEVELSLYVNARNNLLISGNAIKLAEFTLQVILMIINSKTKI